LEKDVLGNVLVICSNPMLSTETDRYFYHSDHLGSSSFISSNLGTTTQHLQYLPFGESFVEQKISTAYLSPYRFSGKERDEETGYSYFGARYYNPELSIWLSVDPLAGKYPHQSPYSYCGWRPINVIDPDGRDEWEINGKGETTKHIKTTAHDAFYMVDKDGKRIEGKSKEFAYGTVKANNTPTVNVRGNPTKLNIFDIKGDDNAKATFEFFSENTTVEWTHAKTGNIEGENGSNMVGTSHEETSTAVGSYLRSKKYTLREVNHNHNNGNLSPSALFDKNNELIGGDLYNRELYLKENPNVKLNIYSKGKGYRSYTTFEDIIKFYPPIFNK